MKIKGIKLLLQSIISVLAMPTLYMRVELIGGYKSLINI